MKAVKGQRWLYDNGSFTFVVEATVNKNGVIVQVIKQPPQCTYKTEGGFYIGDIAGSREWTLLPGQDKE
jgi:hypothetical protein